MDLLVLPKYVQKANLQTIKIIMNIELNNIRTNILTSRGFKKWRKWIDQQIRENQEKINNYNKKNHLHISK